MTLFDFRSCRVLLTATMLGLGTAGCMSTIAGQEEQPRGYVLDESALAQIKPGTDVQVVLTTLGTPSTVSTVGNKTFYYISQTVSQRFKFQEAKVVDQRVLAVYFNQGFKVERIANYGIQDGVVFDFISRTTPTGGQDQSFVRNLFRGLGTFNPFGV